MSQLSDLPWTAVEAARAPMLAVPLGSTEQHGPHLPLSTDTDIASALCARLASARPRVLVAPAVPYGSSGEHDGFAGTLSIGQAALELLLIELVRSACATFPRVLLVNGHGGNAEPVKAAVATLREEGRDVRAWHPGGYRDPHAGRTETSLQLALDPSRVVLSAARPGTVAPLTELLPALRTGGVRAVSANGVLGDPTGASAAEGRDELARLTSELITFVDTHFLAHGRPERASAAMSEERPVAT